jgi:hypothetical protein
MFEVVIVVKLKVKTQGTGVRWKLATELIT